MSALSASSPSVPAAAPPKAPDGKQPDPKNAKPQGAAPAAPQKGIEAGADQEIADLEAAAPKGSRGADAPAPKKDAAPKDEKKAEPAEKKPPEKRKYTLERRGEKEDVELDDDQIRMELQKARAYQAAAKELKQIKEAEAARRERIKKDPFAYLKEEGGIDALDLAAQELIRRHEEAQLPPEQQAMRAKEREIAQREAQIKAQEEAQRTAQERAQEAYLFEQYAKNYAEAAKTLGYDNDFTGSAIVPEMARIERAFVDSGIELTPSDLARMVTERHDTIASARLKSIAGLEGNALLDRLESLSPGLVENVRKAIVAKHRAGQGIVPRPPPEAPREGTKLPLTRKDERDVMLNLKSLRPV